MLLTDEQIDRLLRMPKQVTNPKARKKVQRGSEQINYDVVGDGARFQLFVRQNQRLENGFSCGLLLLSDSGEKVVLTRYNGSDHEHRNPLDKERKMPHCCHIHRATQRYMEAGRKAEHYAEATDRYSSVDGALLALISDCNVSGLSPQHPDQTSLFDDRDD
ncbi:DUF6978 family protein [Achromobacter xylosoxidans]